LGEHGDSSVINWDGATIGGAGIADFARRAKIPLTEKTRAEIGRKVRGAAYEIIRGRGATWDGIAAAATDLAKCVANDERRVLPVSIVDGKSRAAYSMPRIVGRDGVVATIAPEMGAAERNGLAASIRAIRKTYKIVE
jgi:L-lactate dehydrogenase